MFDFVCCRNENNGTLNTTFNCCVNTEVTNQPQQENYQLNRAIYVTVIEQHTMDFIDSLKYFIRGYKTEHFESTFTYTSSVWIVRDSLLGRSNKYWIRDKDASGKYDFAGEMNCKPFYKEILWDAS